MADGIQINTGTGPIVAAELIGTAALQRVKLVLGNVDTDSGDVSVSNMLPITGTGLTIASIATGTVNVVNVISASNVTVASVATGTMNVVNVLSASGVTVASVATGTMNVVNTVTVTAANVTVASVATGTMNVVNVLSASNVTVASVATGTFSMSGTSNVAVVSTYVPVTIGNGNFTVTNSGTAVQISVASVACSYVVLVGNSTNTGSLWVGGSTVTVGNGLPLLALQTQRLDINNLNKVYVNADANGESGTYVYVV